jgi:hypothetical protein
VCVCVFVCRALTFENLLADRSALLAGSDPLEQSHR